MGGLVDTGGSSGINPMGGSHNPHIHLRVRAAEETQGEVVNVTDVEIVQTGMEYPLASGPHTFTTSELQSAVDSQNDPAIVAPRLKLGHYANLGIMADGQPAIGTLGNLRLEQEGHLLVADYLGMPKWLADILPSAYPARSIEADLAKTTVTGHHWECIITDLALLGVVWPGVGTLEDIKALYSVDGPSEVKILSTKEEVEAMAGKPVASKVAAQVDTAKVSKEYYNQLGQGQFWWWIRSMMVDPNELIVENEEKGELFRVPFSVDQDEVNFEEPIPVKVEYVDKPEKAAASVAVFASRKVSREMAGVVASDVDPVALRETLGLDAEASDDDVRAALEAAGVIAPPGQEAGSDSAPGSEVPGTTESGTASTETGEQPPDVTGPSGGDPNDPATGERTEAPSGGGDAGEITHPVAASNGDVVTLDRGTYDRLVAGAEAGLRLDKESKEAERDRIIGEAIKAGKLPPSRKAHYQQAWDNDPDGTRTLLTAEAAKGGLAPGLVPVDERGGEPSLEDVSVEAYPAEWLPELQRNRGGE